MRTLSEERRARLHLRICGATFIASRRSLVRDRDAVLQCPLRLLFVLMCVLHAAELAPDYCVREWRETGGGEGGGWGRGRGGSG